MLLMKCTRKKCAKEDAAMDKAIEAIQKNTRKTKTNSDIETMYTGAVMQRRNRCVVTRCAKEVASDLRVAARASVRRCKDNKTACDVARRAKAMSKAAPPVNAKAYTTLVYDVARS